MTEPKPVVSQYCRIKQNQLLVNGELVFQSEHSLFLDFADACYKHFDLSYPKFHKMDALSKLGLLASDILLKNSTLDIKSQPDRVGVILSNKSSSLDTDIKYYNMVKKGVASPAVFVYSLPNIVIGEICIRNGIKGENTFFISDHYNILQQVQYVNHLIHSNVVDVCICGWVELFENKYDAFLYLVEKSGKSNSLPFNFKTIEELFNI